MNALFALLLRYVHYLLNKSATKFNKELSGDLLIMSQTVAQSQIWIFLEAQLFYRPVRIPPRKYKQLSTPKRFINKFQMLFKLVHSKEIHMLNRKVSFDELQSHIRSAFKKLPRSFSLSYVDKEGDTISVTNQADLDIIYDAKLPSLRLVIEESREELEPQKAGEFEQVPDIVREDSLVSEVGAEQPKVTEEVREETVVLEEQTKEEKVETKAQEKVEEKVEQKVEEKVEEKVQQEKAQQEKPKEQTEQADPLCKLFKTIGSKIHEYFPDLTKRLSQEFNKCPFNESSVPLNKPEPQPTVHVSITCDGCKKYPVVGIRYKCSICYDFDFCESCEATKEHPHAFLKIKAPGQPFFAMRHPRMRTEPQEGVPHHFLRSGLGSLKNLFESFFPGALCDKDKKEKRKSWKERRCAEEKCKEEKVQEKKVEEKAQEEKKCEKPLEKPKEVEKVNEVEKAKEAVELTQEREDRDVAMAYELEQILHLDFWKTLKFVQKHPDLSKDQLVEAYYNGARRRCFWK